jgi:hypothetical protein
MSTNHDDEVPCTVGLSISCIRPDLVNEVVPFSLADISLKSSYISTVVHGTWRSTAMAFALWVVHIGCESSCIQS